MVDDSNNNVSNNNDSNNNDSQEKGQSEQNPSFLKLADDEESKQEESIENRNTRLPSTQIVNELV